MGSCSNTFSYSHSCVLYIFILVFSHFLIFCDYAMDVQYPIIRPPRKYAQPPFEASILQRYNAVDMPTNKLLHLSSHVHVQSAHQETVAFLRW